MDLPDRRHRGRGGVDPLAEVVLGSGLDVDDDVGARKRPLDGRLDRVRRRVALADTCRGGNADHDVGELPASRLPHPETPQLDVGPERRDRSPGRILGAGGGTVHQHVDVAAHQPGRREQYENRDEERRDRVSARIARAREEEPDEHGHRPRQVAGEMERVRCERGAAGAARDAPRDARPAGVDCDDDEDGDEDVPGDVNGRLRRSGEALDRAERR